MEIARYIEAVLCRKCNNIIYSRNGHDFVSCDCGNLGIDDKGYRKTFKEINNKMDVLLDKIVFADMVLHYDYTYGNTKIKEEYLDGYYSKFRLTEYSRLAFYKELLDIESYKVVERIVARLVDKA